MSIRRREEIEDESVAKEYLQKIEHQSPLCLTSDMTKGMMMANEELPQYGEGLPF